MASAQPGAEGRSDDDAIAAPSDANAVTNASNMPGMSIVGPECAAAGITPTVLQNGWGENQERIPVTNMMVAEIAAYREKSKATYPVAKKWLEKLLGQGTFDGVKESSFESSLRSRRTKMAKAKRNKTPKLLEELREVYRPPIPRVPDNAQVPPQPSTSSMSQKLQAARLTKLALQREVREKELEIGKMVVKNFSLEKELEARDRKQKEEEKKMKKRKELLQKKEAKVQQKVITLNVKSWREKLKRRDSKIREQQQKLDMMADTKSELKELKKGKGKESRQLEYWKRRSRALEEDLKAMKKKEKAKEKRVSNLEVEVEDLVEKVREKQRSINLRDGLHKNSPFTFDVRACYMQLLSFQVSAHNLSNVAHCVLSTLGKFDVQRSDFPGETFCQEMLLEANLVTSIQVAEGLTKTTNATIQSDGTTRDGNKVVGMQANANGRTSTIGLQQVSSGTAEDQLDAFQFIFNKMAELTSSPDNTETTYNELVSTLKNTMGDGAASQKLFNELLENYRRDILPKVKL